MHSSLDFPQIHFITRPLFRQRLPEQDMGPALSVIRILYPHLRNGDTSNEDKRTLKAPAYCSQLLDRGPWEFNCLF